jgi:stage II sporulation protein P
MKRRYDKIRSAPLIAVAASAFAAIRLISYAGAYGAIGVDSGALAAIFPREGAAEKLIRAELPNIRGDAPEKPFYTLFFPLADMPVTAPDESLPDAGEIAPEKLPASLPATPRAPRRAAPETFPETAVPSYSESGGSPEDGIIIKNNSGLELDASKLISEPLQIKIKDGEPSVLIVHTHSSEAYTRSPGETFEESDPYRTEDKAFSIIRVGDELSEALGALGVSVVHDRELYDYPSYAGSYGRSLEASKRYLEKYPSISLVIDLHRDAISTPDGSQYKTIADIGGELCSQIMLVVGTDGSGLQHPGWRDNMKLALRLQREMNASFPTLARPITLAKYRYNQHLTPGSLIVEVGSAGNTLSESLSAVRYFAEAYAAVLEESTG